MSWANRQLNRVKYLLRLEVVPTPRWFYSPLLPIAADIFVAGCFISCSVMSFSMAVKQWSFNSEFRQTPAPLQLPRTMVVMPWVFVAAALAFLGAAGFFLFLARRKYRRLGQRGFDVSDPNGRRNYS